MMVLPSFLKSKIGRKLTFSVVCLSSLITLVLTTAQFGFDYITSIDEINKQFSLIEGGYKSSITEALWTDDRQQLKTLIKGIYRFPNMEIIKVLGEDQRIISIHPPSLAGRCELSHSFLAVQIYEGQKINLGKVVICAHTMDILNLMKQRILIMLGSNTVKTFIVSLFFLFLVGRLVIRPIEALSAQSMRMDIDNLKGTFTVNKHDYPTKGDEIECLIKSLNIMRQRIYHGLHEQEKARQALQAAKAKYQDLYDSSPDMYLTINLDSRLVENCNKTLMQKTGYSKSEIVSKPFINLCSLDYEGQMEEIFLNLRSKGLVLNVAIGLLCKDSCRLDAILNARVTNNPTKSSIGGFHCQTTLRDITDLKELRKQKDYAERAVKEKSQFLAMIAHDLRTPLNAMIGFSDLLLSTRFGSLPEKQKVLVMHILNSSHHLLKLTSDLGVISSYNRCNLQINMQSFDFDGLVLECIEQHRPIADKKGITIINEYNKIGVITGDRDRLLQVITNLLTNAIKFCQENGKVGIRAMIETNDIIFSIWDTGVGIESKYQESIFTPYDRGGHAIKAGSGMGLGLAIAKKLVELHNGKIWLKSAPGKGSEFFVSLPRDMVEGIESIT